ncbi:MAG: hypothetical protein HQK81_00630 [Desulfovibrionaceae bacterium]|nr:hypothetical protein [Desulfovibrionaceae bacterium]MBF0512552.1 hypothetical protein [Desulfovibrionaceae bacterium]
MDTVWIVVLFAAALLSVLWGLSKSKSRYYLAKQELAKNLTLFSRDYFVGYDGKGAIAIDKKSRKILLVATDGQKQKVVSFSGLLAVALVEDGSPITKTTATGVRNLSREAVDALTGTFPSGEAAQNNAGAATVRRIELRVTVADQGDPHHGVFFLDEPGRGLPRSSGRYAKVRGLADHWCAMLQVLVKQADDDEAKPRQTAWRESVVA